MRRRDFVKALAAVPVAVNDLFGQTTSATYGQKTPAPQSSSTAAAPPEAETAPQSLESNGLLGYRSQPIDSTIPDAVATTEGHFFHPQQMATLRKLGDVLLPPMNGYPGSTQAGAPEFLDFLIGASPALRQHMYRTGLDWLNAETEKHFGIPFAKVNAEQADKLLRPWLRTWMTYHPPTEPYAHFINLAHQDIRTATMNSQEWSIAATSSGERAPGVGLYWSPIDPDIQRYV
ncbi:MAG: gluconate 2-dehydrogenase subunit 3 family protein [Acidobacteriaceae bacterium]